MLERRTRRSVVLLADGPPIVLEGTGVAIWDAFPTARAVRDVVATLAATYGAPVDEVEPAVVAIVDELRSAGALVAAPPRRRRYRALDLTISLDADDDALRTELFELFAPLGTDDAASTAIDVRPTPAAAFTVQVDGAPVCETDVASHALAHTCWEINSRAIAATTATLVFHASAVARDGVAVLLPGASGSGKSTLAASLVTAGFAYLTDDVAALDRSGTHLRPYPKPIALRRDVLAQFPALVRPDDRTAAASEEIYATAAMLGGKNAAAARPRLVVFPTYACDAENAPVRISRADALVALAEHSFNFLELGGPALDTLAQMVRACDCYRMEYSDAAAVVAFVTETLSGARAGVVTRP